jgi:hypothetical protein
VHARGGRATATSHRRSRLAQQDERAAAKSDASIVEGGRQPRVDVEERRDGYAPMSMSVDPAYGASASKNSPFRDPPVAKYARHQGGH